MIDGSATGGRPATIQDVPRDLGAIEPSAEHEAVQAVALHRAGPHLREGGFKALMLPTDINLAEWRDQTEILHPDRLQIAGGRDRNGLFRIRLQAHVFEDRQDIRERARRTGAADLET